MPTLRELNKRLKSAETIGQLAGAMRSAATASYLKVSSVLTNYLPYDEALRSLRTSFREPARSSSAKAAAAGAEPEAAPSKRGRELLILCSGRHGLCGSYHQALFSFFSKELKKHEPSPAVITCGQKAFDHCTEKGLCVLKDHPVSEIPAYSEARELASFISGLHDSGEVGSVIVIYQSFVNMLKQVPTADIVLSEAQSGEPEPDGSAKEKPGPDEGPLLIPDRAAVEDGLDELILASELYAKLLSAAAGAQAATMIAMRSASDNAEEAANKLEIEINRLRQADITASVLETSADPNRSEE